MQKKLTDPSDWSREDVIQIAGISEEFKNFMLEYGVDNMGHAMAKPEEMLPALQVADKKSGLTSKVLCLFKELNLSLMERDTFYCSVVDKGTGEQRLLPKEQSLYSCIKVLAKFEWPDKALEFYAHIIAKAGFDALDWRELFDDYRGEKRAFILAGNGADFCGPIKPAKAYIAEGVWTHFEEEPPSSSPFSFKYWINPERWGASEDDDVCASQQKEGKDICSYLAMFCYARLVSAGKYSQAENLTDWLSHMGNCELITEEHFEEFNRVGKTIPASDPSEVVGQSEEDSIPIMCDALWHDVWVDRAGSSREPSEVDKREVFDFLSSCATRYLSGKIRFHRGKKHALVNALIQASGWAPEGKAWFSAPPHSVELSSELLHLMRSRIVYERGLFNPYEYKQALHYVVSSAEQPVTALKQLLIAMRACPEPCSNEALEFKPLVKIGKQVYFPNTEPFKDLSPEECISCFVHMIIDGPGDKRELCLSLAEYCLSRIKPKKGSKGRFDKSQGVYSDSLCMEEDPIWRRAYVMALGELGYDVGGTVHGPLQFVRDHDPNDLVRKEAKHALKIIKRETTKNLNDRKGLLAAFFWLRWAQRDALGAQINEGLAMLTRRGELRGDFKHRADLLYNNFI